MLLTRIEYMIDEDDIPVIYLWARDGQNLRRFKEKFYPYLYVRTSEIIPELLSHPAVVKVEDYGKALDGEHVSKVVLKVPRGYSLTTIMEEIRRICPHTYESKIMLVLRYLIDKGIKDCINEKLEPVDSSPEQPRILYIDIEIANPGTESIEPYKPDYPITCISYYDSYAQHIVATVWHPKLSRSVDVKEVSIKTYKPKEQEHKYKVIIQRFSKEEEMIRFFLDYVRDTDPDIITGYYAVPVGAERGLDIPYIINRAKKLGIDPNVMSPFGVVVCSPWEEENRVKIMGRELFDLFDGIKRLQKPTHDLPKWTLAYVSEYFLGIKTAERKHFAKELWEKSPETMLKYNVMDVIKMHLLDQEVGIIEQFDWRRRIVGCRLEDVLYDTRATYILLLREKGPPLPDRWEAETYLKAKGAYVKEPQPGVKRNVAVFDIKAAYPTVMLDFNISPETLVASGNGVKIEAVLKDATGKEIECPVFYNRDKIGLIPSMLKKFINARLLLRDKLKKATDPQEKRLLFIKDRSFKFFINGVYGVTGNEHFPLYNPLITASVTSIVREILMFCEKKLTEKGYEVLYCDTDSLYVQLTRDIEEAKQLEAEINSMIKEYIKAKWGIDSTLTVELSTIYKWVMFVEKSGTKEGAKKKLVGETYWKDGVFTSELELLGTLMKETSLPKISVEVQGKIIDMVKEGKIEEIVEYLKEVLANYEQLPPDMIAIPRAIAKDKYKNPTAVARGIAYAIEYFNHPKPNVGVKLKYIYVKRVRGYPSTDVIAYEDPKYIPWERIEIDYRKMKDITIRKVIEPLLNSLGISWVYSGLPVFYPKKHMKPYILILQHMDKQKKIDEYLLSYVDKLEHAKEGPPSNNILC